MNRITKTMLLSGGDKRTGQEIDPVRYDRDREREDTRRDMRRNGEYPENRSHGRDGREHYDDSRYDHMRGYDDGRPYSRYDDTRSTGGEYRRGEGDRWYGEHERRYDQMEPMGFHDDSEKKSMNIIGFYGSGRTSDMRPLSRETADHWLREMKNEDGTTGPHWTMEQTKQVMAQKGIECDPLEFNVAINMIYSDYSGVAKKLGVNNIDFYACMAKAFLDDKDAQPDKLARYYEYVVK